MSWFVQNLLIYLSLWISNIDLKFYSENTSTYYSKVIDSSLSLNSDISLIKSIWKVSKNKLNELGIFNIKDLINYFPRTYLDYTNRVKINNLRPDNLSLSISELIVLLIDAFLKSMKSRLLIYLFA